MCPQIAPSPGGGGRTYQERAIRAVCHRYEDGEHGGENQRKALLVMATGSGKTRVAIALSDVLMNANWAKRILFLADRVPLVKQATGNYRKYLPDCATVNLVLEPGAEGRVFVSTYPTMMNLIEKSRQAGQQRFGPGFFDLVIIDEAHRSVYRKYKAIFDWFDAPLPALHALVYSLAVAAVCRFRPVPGQATRSLCAGGAMRDFTGRACQT